LYWCTTSGHILARKTNYLAAEALTSVPNYTQMYSSCSLFNLNCQSYSSLCWRGSCGCDRMVIGFITT